VLYLTIAMIPVLVGIAGTIILPDLSEPASVLPAMGKAYLPAIGMALFAGAMFSALMSSADGGMLAPASIFGNNVWRAISSNNSEERVLRVSRIAVIVVGIFGLATALFFQNVYQLMVKSFSILMVGLFVPMTAAIYWKRANEWGAVASMLSGLLSWIAIEYWNQNIAEILLPAELMAAGVSLLVLLVVSFSTVHRNPPKPSVDVDGQQIEMTERLGILGFPRAEQRRQS
jgi:Na+/proline symporter